jgi:predicted ATP-binding protein involved in virulence
MRQQTYAYLQDLDLSQPLPDQKTSHPLQAIGPFIAQVVEDADEILFSVKHDALIVRMADKHHMPFHMLSDGYRNLIAMTADIAWRAPA